MIYVKKIGEEVCVFGEEGKEEKGRTLGEEKERRDKKERNGRGREVEDGEEEGRERGRKV